MTTRSETKRTSTLIMLRRGAMSQLAFPLTALVSSPLLARSLHADGRGVLAAVSIPFAIAANSLTLGLPETLTLHVARRVISPRQASLLTIAVPLCVGSLTAVIAWIAMPWLLHQYPDYIGLGRTIFLLVPAALMIQALRGTALGGGELRLVFLERYLSTGFRLVPLVLLVSLGWLTVTNAAWVTLTAGILSGVALLVAFRRILPLLLEPSVGTGAVLHYGWAIWLGAVAQFLTFRFDQLVLAGLVSAASLGAYAVAVSLAEVSNSLTNAVREVIYSRASMDTDLSLVARGCRVALVVSALFAILAGAAVQIGLVLIFGSDFATAIQLTQLLLLASIGSGVGAVVGIGLAVAGKPGRWSQAQFGGLLCTGALIFPVIHEFGATGAAVLSVLSYWLTTVVGLLFLSRVSGKPVREYVVPTSSDVKLVLAQLRRSE